jgi:hypothetical protein
MILKAIRLSLAVALMFLFSTALVSAQRLDLYFGMGTARTSPQAATDSLGNPVTAPSLGGVFGTVGGGVFLKPTFGVGAQVSWRFAKADFPTLGTTLGYRPVFYDFNGIWTPMSTKRVVPEFQAGFGGASLRLYDPTQQYYDYNTGRYTSFIGSSNHLQLHVAAGLRFFIKPHLFIRPGIDYHWVRNLSNELGTNNVPEYTIAIGYSSREVR